MNYKCTEENITNEHFMDSKSYTSVLQKPFVPLGSTIYSPIGVSLYIQKQSIWSPNKEESKITLVWKAKEVQENR